MIRTQYFICAGLLLLGTALVIAPASAWTIQNWSGPANGATLPPGSTVTIAFDINFDSWMSGDFDSKHSINLYSDLTTPKWTVTKTVMVNDDMPLTSSLVSKQGTQVRLDGWDLTDAANSYTITVLMSGTVPTLDASKEIISLRVQEMDSDAVVIKSTIVKKTVNVAVPTPEPTAIPEITPEETVLVITPEPTTAAPAAVTTPTKKVTYSPGPEPLAICGTFAGLLLVLGLMRRRI